MGTEDCVHPRHAQPSVRTSAEQTQDKVVLSVKPGAAEGQTGTFPQGTDILKGVFVRIFGVNCFVRGKINGLRCSGETIHTENSYKYSLEDIRALGKRAGLTLSRTWFDR